MPKARVLKAGGIKLGDDTHDQYAVIDIADDQVFKNLVYSRKIAPHDIDAMLAQAPATLTEKLDQDRAAAENVMAGAHVSSDPAPAETEAEPKQTSAKTVTKKKK